MRRPKTEVRPATRAAGGLALACLLLVTSGGAAGPGVSLQRTLDRAEVLARRGAAWYQQTPPLERVGWGGLVACATLGLVVALGRAMTLRRRRVVPKAFVERFTGRLGDGKLDRAKALDLCELNASPAAQVALAAVRRWGRPASELERAVGLAVGLERARLARHVGTLRRIAALAPLLGLLATLAAIGRVLATVPAGAAWGPALGTALHPLTAGVALAIVALFAFDALTVRVDGLAEALDRLGAETVDGIAAITTAQAARPAADQRPRIAPVTASAAIRTPHAFRVEIPDDLARPPGTGVDYA